MKTEIEWFEVHAPLFINGCNLGVKIDRKTKGGVGIWYDEEKRHLFVTYNGKTARIPEPSILSMIEAAPATQPKIVVNQGVASFNPHAAQVESPMSHVHAGLGHGQTGQEAPKKAAAKPKAII